MNDESEGQNSDVLDGCGKDPSGEDEYVDEQFLKTLMNRKSTVFDQRICTEGR
jgi:hypothetical protein